jgi:hypothetical protein
VTIKNTFFHDDLVWVRSYGAHKSAIGRVDKVFQSGNNIWAEVIIGPEGEAYLYDWDQENKLLNVNDEPRMQVEIYRLEHVKFEKLSAV